MRTSAHGSFRSVLNFCGIPDGLNAKELEKFLRKNGAEITLLGSNQEYMELRDGSAARQS